MLLQLILHSFCAPVTLSTSFAMAVSVWSVLSGFMWGLGSGVGFMLWVLVRLLNFQKKEVGMAASSCFFPVHAL